MSSSSLSHARRRLYRVHSWTGLSLGLLLYVVCFSGSTALFTDELFRWERPGVRFGAVDSPAIDPIVRRELHGIDAEHGVLVFLPSTAHPTVGLSYEVHTDAGEELFHHREIDPRSGAEIGDQGGVGHFLRELHANLLIEGRIGRYAVGLVGLAFLLSIATGVVIHAKFFRHLFTYRGDESRNVRWLDTHNVFGVWLLPFHAIIAFSGALLGLVGVFLTVLAFSSFGGDVEKATEAILGTPPVASGRDATMVDIDAVIADLRRREPIADRMLLHIEHWGDANAEAHAFVARDGSLDANHEHRYSLATGEHLGRKSLGDSYAGRLYAAMLPLHYATFGGFALKLAYLIMGIGSSVLVASGLMVWLVRREKQYPKTHGAMRRLLPGFTTGMATATAAAFIAEHALPQTDAPVFWVGVVYFATWTVTIAAGLALADARRATGLGILATGVLLALAGPVHWRATGDHLLRSAGRGDWYVAGTDLTLLGVATAAIACAVRILSSRPVAATTEHRNVAGDTALTAARRPIAAK